jgi:hypothetical protein
MGALVETRTVEAEIADCCQAIYRATEPDVALNQWALLRRLLAVRKEAENSLFRREATQTLLNN